MENKLPITTKLKRAVQAILIPNGTPQTLAENTAVQITQILGGNFTVNVNGAVYRINHWDADALNQPETATFSPEKVEQLSLKEQIFATLRTCYDPEIAVNLVDLGLIYDVAINPLPKDESLFCVTITMTLTSPTCSMAPFILADVKSRVLALPNIHEVDVNLVFDPPWDASRLSEEVKLTLNLS